MRLHQLIGLVLFFLNISFGSYAEINNSSNSSTSKAVQQSSFYVVLNRARAHEQLNTDLVKRIFSLRQLSWADEHAIQIISYPDAHPIHIQFTQQVLGVFPYQLRKHWDRQIYTGAAPAPKRVKSLQALVSLITNLTDAIGYSDTEVSNEHVYSVQIHP